jgi:hypothetical protein
MIKVQGRCHCGAIAYEAEVEPGTVNVCHCLDCQMLTGSAFRANIAAPAKGFRFTGGKPRSRFASGPCAKKKRSVARQSRSGQGAA